MLKLFIRKRSPPAEKSAICIAHRNSIKEISDDKSSFVRKDVFKEYAQRMDERCGNHEDLIADVSKKIDKMNQLFIGLVVSLLITGFGFILNAVLRSI